MIAAFFVRQWRFAFVVFLLLALLGVQAFLTVSQSENPAVPAPVVFVRVALPGTSPHEMEQLVARPIEDAIESLDNVKNVSSVNRDGTTVTTVEFAWGVDPERKYDEVVREIDAIRNQLPQGISLLQVQRVRTSEVSIAQIALVSDILPMRRLEKIAHALRDRLDRIAGVRRADWWGAPPSEMRVSVDLAKLAQFQIPLAAVAGALQARGEESPVGAVHAGDRRFDLSAEGAFTAISAIEATPIAVEKGDVIVLGNVANISWETVEPQYLTAFDGRRAVFVTVAQKDGADVAEVSERIREALGDFERSLPGNVALKPFYFQADGVQERLGRLYRDFGLALGLVLLTLLPLGWRAGLVVAVSIPLSLLVGLAAIKALGFNLNGLSIAGFVLALGLVVDDSIVVTENIARRLRQGADRIAAAVQGTGQIARAVAGCTAALMLAFVPLLAIPAAPGAFIRSLPITVLCTVAASFLVAMVIIPFLASRLLRETGQPHGNWLLQAVNRAMEALYRPTLRWALDNQRIAALALVLLCALAIPMFQAIGWSLFPESQMREFLVRIETQNGTALSGTRKALTFAEGALRAEPNVTWFASNLGRGNPQVYYNVYQHEPDTTYAEIFAQVAAGRASERDRVLAALREKFRVYPGARFEVLAFHDGPVSGPPIDVRVSGPDSAVLRSLAERVAAAIRATPGARDVVDPVTTDQVYLDLGMDAQKAARLGVPAGVARAITRIALSGQVVANFRDGDGDLYPVNLRLPMRERNDVSILRAIYVPTAGGQTTPLVAIATPTLRSGPPEIDRYNRERTVTVTSFVDPGLLASDVTRAVRETLNGEIRLPPGYRMVFGGENEAGAESFGDLGAAILIAVLGILVVLVLEFGRFRIALVVAAVTPLGILGAIAALWLTGNSLSFTAAIGIAALIGIEIKNSILLVDFSEQLRREGTGLREAIERASEIRFLPVLLTSVTAICGLLPLALENNALYSPLAIAIIGGLIASTLISRIATPVTYMLAASRTRSAGVPPALQAAP